MFGHLADRVVNSMNNYGYTGFNGHQPQGSPYINPAYPPANPYHLHYSTQQPNFAPPSILGRRPSLRDFMNIPNMVSQHMMGSVFWPGVYNNVQQQPNMLPHSMAGGINQPPVLNINPRLSADVFASLQRNNFVGNLQGREQNILQHVQLFLNEARVSDHGNAIAHQLTNMYLEQEFARQNSPQPQMPTPPPIHNPFNQNPNPG